MTESEHQMQSTARKLFGGAARYLDIIDDILPVALRHEYRFMSDETFAQRQKSGDFSIEELNFITSLELIEKAHLAAVTALIRTKRWVEAICLMADADNFVGFASTARGLVESAGDIVDGLLKIAPSLAEYHNEISVCLAGKESGFVIMKELEEPLDHYVHARWIRVKAGDKQIKAKDNASYVRALETAVPGALSLYHRLCSITHPSSASIDYLYDIDSTGTRGMKLAPSKDASAIDTLCREFPSALHDVLMMSCNPSLLILRVLHKFGIHPQLKGLKKLEFAKIKAWPGIEKHLKH